VTSCDQHLAAVRAALRPLEGEVREISAGLTEDQLQWSPEPGRWSIAQCFEHLVAAAQQYHPRLSAAIDGSRPAAGAGATRFRSTLFGGMLVNAMRDTTGRRRYRAPRIFRPASRPAPGAPERVLAVQRELAELLARAADRDLVRTKLRSPVTPLLRLNLGEALELQVVHMARHLAQARRVREHPAFPTRAR
jgi:hypothetical protein